MLRAISEAGVVGQERLDVIVGRETNRGDEVNGVQGGDRGRQDALRGIEYGLLEGKEGYASE